MKKIIIAHLVAFLVLGLLFTFFLEELLQFFAGELADIGLWILCLQVGLISLFVITLISCCLFLFFRKK